MNLAWQIAPVAEFDRHQASWAEIARRCGDSPLLDPLFVRPLIKEFGRPDDVLAIGGPEDMPFAMGIFRRAGQSGWQTFQPANAPLGLLVSDGAFIEGGPASEERLEGLSKALPGPALLVGLSQLDPDFVARPSESGRMVTLDYIDTARLTMAGNYEDYWAQRGKNLRHNMKRQRNRLDREGVTTRLEKLVNPGDMRDAVSDYAALESAGWKESIDSAVHLDDPQGQFYVAMLEAFAARGEALVLRFFYGDDVVATDLCIRRNEILIILKTTYDESRKGTSPAHLMRHEMVKDAFSSGEVNTIEFYGPAQDWHRKWTDDIRTIYHANFYRWSMIRRLAEARKAFA